MKADLAFIKSNLSFLVAYITDLETAGLPLSRSLAIVDKAKQKINDMPAKGKVFKEKLEQVVKKNGGLEILKQANLVLQGESDALPPGWSVDQTTAVKYCPVASVDVERSFSQFKNVFSDRRHNFTQENLAKMTIINYFHARKE